VFTARYGLFSLIFLCKGFIYISVGLQVCSLANIAPKTHVRALNRVSSSATNRWIKLAT